MVELQPSEAEAGELGKLHPERTRCSSSAARSSVIRRALANKQTGARGSSGWARSMNDRQALTRRRHNTAEVPQEAETIDRSTDEAGMGAVARDCVADVVMRAHAVLALDPALQPTRTGDRL